ncbi:deoxycytidine deaminase [Streptomyces sp. NBC_00708]
MILTGQGIAEAVHSGDIVITPFQAGALNPNSYSYHLGDTLRTIVDGIIDARTEHEYREHRIGDEGFVLRPHTTYLGTTEETIGSSRYVPSLIGRSSMGRLGVFLQVSADLGNLGAVHKWTLEIVVCQPVRIYRGMVAGQVTFWKPEGDRTPYSGYFGTRSDAALPDPLQFDVR